MNISISIEDNTWKIVIYFGSIIAFFIAMLPVYLFSTLSTTEKNSIMFNVIIDFGLFMVLVFLIVEVIDVNRKLEKIIKELKETSTKTVKVTAE
jgi:hypothetical protein